MSFRRMNKRFAGASMIVSILLLAITPANSQDLMSGELECDGGGGTFTQVLDSTEKTMICVALKSGPNCKATLRELPGTATSKNIVVEGGPRIVCMTARRAAVICQGKADGTRCQYQVVSVGRVFDPLFLYLLLSLVLAILFIILLFILLRWRALGPFFLNRQE